MLQSVNNYCERLDPSFWAEPLNAVSNISFIIFALIALFATKNKHDPATKFLVSILILIGIGSFLFHSFAQIWAGFADVLPILAFILAYIFFASKSFLGLSPFISMLTVFAFFPFAIGVSWLINNTLGPINGSAPYVSVAILIAIYALLLAKTATKTSLGLFIGAALLLVSITFRSIDQTLCSSFPAGTHFVWHLLNGAMLGWMIIVLARHTKD